MAKYSNSIKKEMCIKVCVNKESTILVANNYNVPIKTFEKWITAFNKDCSVFDEDKPIHYQASQSKPSNNDYDSMNIDELKKELMRRDIEISRLKKGYYVKGRGQAKECVICKMKTIKL